jgi:hypothetical protein
VIPLWIKVVYTALVALIVPVYWRHYGPKNFLWFSDIALLTLVAALWMENALLASMTAVSVLLLELTWNFSFISGLIAGRQIEGLTGYMFNRRYSRFLRSLSLFHVLLPPLLLLVLWRLGYDPRAPILQTAVAWAILPLTYLAKPEENINWVYGPGAKPQKRMHPLLWLALLMLLYPLCVYLPTHLLLSAIF